MKKIFLFLSLMMAATATMFAAKDPDPNVEEVFKKEFPGAQAVSWSEQEGFQKATFILAGHRTIAYFDQHEELLGCVRDIFYDQLPMAVMKAVDKKFQGADFSEVRELSNADGTSYLLTVDKDRKKFKVQVTSDGSFSSIDRVGK